MVPDKEWGMTNLSDRRMVATRAADDASNHARAIKSLESMRTALSLWPNTYHRGPLGAQRALVSDQIEAAYRAVTLSHAQAKIVSAEAEAKLLATLYDMEPKA